VEIIDFMGKKLKNIQRNRIGKSQHVKQSEKAMPLPNLLTEETKAQLCDSCLVEQ